jgi:hypothetical protein
MSIQNFFKKKKKKILPYEFGYTLFTSLISAHLNKYISDMDKFSGLTIKNLTDIERIKFIREFMLFLSSLIAGVVIATFESDTLSSIMNGFIDAFFTHSKNSLPFQSPQEIKDSLQDRCQSYFPYISIWNDPQRDSKKLLSLSGVFLKNAFEKEITDKDLEFSIAILSYLCTFFNFIPEATNELLDTIEVSY